MDDGVKKYLKQEICLKFLDRDRLYKRYKEYCSKSEYVLISKEDFIKEVMMYEDNISLP